MPFSNLFTCGRAVFGFISGGKRLRLMGCANSSSHTGISGPKTRLLALNYKISFVDEVKVVQAEFVTRRFRAFADSNAVQIVHAGAVASVVSEIKCHARGAPAANCLMNATEAVVVVLISTSVVSCRTVTQWKSRYVLARGTNCSCG